MGKLHHSILKSVFSFISRNDPPPHPFDKEKVRKILLINTTAIGDTLLTTPAIRAIKKTFPSAHTAALVSRSAGEVLKGSPHIDEFITYPGRLGLKYVLKLPVLVGRLRAGFDLAVVLDGNDPDIGPLAYLTGAPWRMGWEESRFSFLFTMPVKTHVSGKHIVDTELDCLKALGIEPSGRGLELFLTDDDFRAAEKYAWLYEKGKSFISIHPFGSKKNKWWPEENVIKFVKLAEKKGFGSVVFGGEKEAETARRIASGSSAISTAGKLTLRGSAALMKKSALVVTTDSGLLHIAQALNIPTVALFGPDDPLITGPVNAGDIVIRKEAGCVPCRKKTCAFPEEDCMGSLKAEDVFEKAMKRLSGTS